jgi:hypothetical protein
MPFSDASSNNNWGPEIIENLARAYEQVIERASREGILKDENRAVVTDHIARYIVMLAKFGIHDAKRLTDHTCAYILKTHSEPE